MGRAVGIDDIDQSGPFRTAKACELTQLVSLDAFASGRDCHILAVPPSSRSFAQPRVVTDSEGSGYAFQVPAGMPIDGTTWPTHLASPALYLSRISDVICQPGGTVITKDGVILEEVFTAYWEHGLHHWITRDEAGAYRLNRPQPLTGHISGSYLYLDFQHLGHFGHFIIDVLSRCWAVRYMRDVLGMGDTKILMTRHGQNFIYEMLEAVGVRREDIFEIDGAVTVSELFVATKAFQVHDYASPAAGEIWRDVGSFYRSPATTSGRRLYLSRSRWPARALSNEAEIEQIFVSHGFEVLHTHEMSVPEKIEAVADAELLAGPSGSGMFLAAFGSRLRSIFVMVSPLLIHTTDVMLQYKPEVSITYYVGQLDRSQADTKAPDFHGPWIIADLDRLAKAVAEWVAGAASV